MASSSQASASLSRCALSAGEAARRASSTVAMAFLLYSYSFLIMGATRVSTCHPMPANVPTRSLAMRSGNLEKDRMQPQSKRPAIVARRSARKGPAESGGLGVGTAGRVDIQPRCAKSVPTYQMKKPPSEPRVPFRTTASPAKIVPASTRSRAKALHGREGLCVCVFAEFYGACPRSLEAIIVYISNSRCSRMRISPPRNYLNTDAAKGPTAAGFQTA